MTHELKIWPQYYCRVADGTKTFEVRVNDRGFQPGDEVILKEWDPTPIQNSVGKGHPKGFVKDSPPLHFKIGYMMSLDKETVVFSLLPSDQPKTVAKKRKG